MKLEGLETKFNWGGMLMPFAFAIGNKSWLGLISLVAFIPVIGWWFAIVWSIFYGFKAEAWSKAEYRDNQEFRAVMATWNRAGIASAIVTAVTVVLALIFWNAILYTTVFFRY